MRRKTANIYKYLGLLTLAGLIFGAPLRSALAQTDEIDWMPPINISNSPDSTSTDPFLLSDPSGVVHLFWGEKVSEIPSNQPDTLLYSRFSGDDWSKPIDLFFAPFSDGTPFVGFPHAVLDQAGNIHLIWLSQPNFPYYTVYYSSVRSDQAMNVQSWQPQRVLADDLTGTHYSIDIAYEPPETLHVILARGAQGETPKEDRTVGYMRSTNGGATWSEPVDLFTVPVINWGASHTRIITEPPGKVFASWTVWGDDGNGRAIYFTRSNNSGLSWDEPVKITEKKAGEYERDWNNLVVIGENKIMSMWEGGYRAYRYARYSEDGGESWGEEIDTFPNLIGENGFAEFDRDSNGTLHLFIAQRHREGSSGPSRPVTATSEETLWHSVWENNARWSDPVVCGGYYAMVNPKVVIANGNEVFATWYAPPTYEIFVMRGRIQNAPPVPPIQWAVPLPEGQPEPETVPEDIGSTPVQLPTAPALPNDQPPRQSLDPGFMIMIGIAPVLIGVPVFILLRKRTEK